MKKTFALDFVGVGFPRCGTTWLSHCLNEHPEIAYGRDASGKMMKEPHFFNMDFEYEKGLEWFAGAYFSHAKPHQIKGEFTTTYFDEIKTLERIKSHFPDVKILVVMRDPFDRAFSHFLYRKRKAGTPKEFSELFEDDPKSVIEWGYYAKYLKQIYSVFPKERVLVINHDDHKIDPHVYIQEVYRFLGVDDNFVPESLHADINRSKNLRYYVPSFQWLFSLRYQLKQYLPGRLVISFLKYSGLGKLLLSLRNLNKKPAQEHDNEFLSADDRAKLQEIYAEDIVELEVLLGRDLSAWKQV